LSSYTSDETGATYTINTGGYNNVQGDHLLFAITGNSGNSTFNEHCGSGNFNTIATDLGLEVNRNLVVAGWCMNYARDEILGGQLGAQGQRQFTSVSVGGVAPNLSEEYCSC